MKNTVIFDMDGLLINTEIISFQIYCDLLKKYEKDFTKEEYSRNYSGKTEVSNMNRIIKEYQLPITLEDGIRFTEEKEKEYFEKGVELKKGAIELLVYLKQNHYKIILATSSSRKRAMIVLRQNYIEEFFDDMVFGTEICHGKPHPEIFLKACEKAESMEKDSLVLEDSEMGIQAANSAGIDVICIPDMKFPQEKYCNMTIAVLDSLDEVTGWLQKQE